MEERYPLRRARLQSSRSMSSTLAAEYPVLATARCGKGESSGNGRSLTGWWRSRTTGLRVVPRPREAVAATTGRANGPQLCCTFYRSLDALVMCMSLYLISILKHLLMR